MDDNVGRAVRYSATRAYRRWWRPFVVPVPLIVGLILQWWMPQLPAVFDIGFVLIGSLAAFLIYVFTPALKLTMSASLEVGPAGVRFDDEQLATRRAITRADVITRDDGDTYLIVKRRVAAPLVFLLNDPSTERALLYALGFDTLQRTTRYRAASSLYGSAKRAVENVVGTVRLLGFMVIFFGFPVAMGSTNGSKVEAFVVLMAGLALGFGVVVPFLLWPSRVEVDTEEVFIEWLWYHRTIATSSIAEVKRTQRGTDGTKRHTVDLLLNDGERYVIPMRLSRFGRRNGTALAKRIEAAIAPKAQHQRLDAHLHRRGRSILGWYEALRASGGGASNHRTGHVGADQLWEVLEHSESRREERVAAAIALREQLGPDDRPRLLRVAATTEEPRMRIALDCIADENASEEELIATLAEVGEVDPLDP